VRGAPVVHQFVPSLHPGDATTQHALELRRLLQDMGIASDIFCTHVHAEHERDARHYTEHLSVTNPGDVLIYQMASHSLLAHYLFERPEPLVVNYHNVTPPRFSHPWDPGAVANQQLALEEVVHLAERASLGICDSAFNAADLAALGYPATTVAPVLIDYERFADVADPVVVSEQHRRKEHGGADLLFVGRVSPHKAQHDLVAALAAYRQFYDPRARLTLVGRASPPSYLRALERFIAALGLAGAVNLVGGVSHSELVAYYQTADVLVSTSEHEGFCVPLLEAMFHGVPVVAFSAGAVSDTVGSAGLLLSDKAPYTLAGAVHRVLGDEALRSRLVIAGGQRLERFSLARTRRAMSEALEPLLLGEPEVRVGAQPAVGAATR